MFREHNHNDKYNKYSIILIFLFVHFIGTSWTNNSPSSPPTRFDRDNHGRSLDGSVVEKQNVSASTPVKNDRSFGRIDMSSNNISPIHDCHTNPAESRLTVTSPPTDRYRRGLPATALSSVSDRGNVAIVTKPFVPRSPSGRSAMDLYAAIHESKKRLLGGQQQSAAAMTAVTTTAVTRQSSSTVSTSASAPLSQRRPQPATGRQSDRYRQRATGDERSARYDFKRLLLQTNMAGGRRTQQSAVVRLQQPTPLQPVARSSPVVVAGRNSRGPTSPSWKSNVLSSTIQEDCREDEDYYPCNGDNDGVLKSAALVNRTLKSLAAATTCSTLETAL